MKRKIAVTGGIGSGKSTFLGYVRKAGYPIFSCDEIYKEIVRSASYVEKIAQVFPDCVKDSFIDKAKLAAVVFQDEEKRRLLNEIAHPMIMQSLYQKMDECEGEWVFAEVPLLFEGNYQEEFDKVVVLMREKNARVASVSSRDGLTGEEVEDRMASQFDYHSPQAKRIFEKCNAVIIDNDQGEAELEKKINDVLSSWR